MRGLARVLVSGALAVVIAVGSIGPADAGPADDARPADAGPARGPKPPVDGLVRCTDVPRAWCGTIARPLDPTRPNGASIDIVFELHPAGRRPNRPSGTIVAVEGGPGYSTRSSRDYYLDLYAPLLDTHQLLLVDNRGTGGSAVIDCPELQSYVGDYIENVRTCSRSLGRNTDVWGTAFAVDDMVAVLDHLGVDQIDLYGDSYGSFFAQAFTVHHPDRVRTVVLDATYPVADQNPWYPDMTRAIGEAFRTVCKRDPGCNAIGGDPLERLRRLADAVTTAPLTGDAPTADGQLQTVTVDAPMLSALAGAATFSTSVYRELDAAGRAWLDAGDPAPLLRIASEQNPPGDAGDLADWSEGLYVAVICNDYPQLWDISSPVRTRQAQFDAAVADLRATAPDVFFPFTIDEWLASPWTEFRSCIGWAPPSTWIPPVPQPPAYPDVPVLVLVGDLDTITSPEGSQIVASNFPGSTYVEVVNTLHVTALGDYSRCASDLVINYVDSGGDAGDTSCAGEYNEVRTVEEFPQVLAAVTPRRRIECRCDRANRHRRAADGGRHDGPVVGDGRRGWRRAARRYVHHDRSRRRALQDGCAAVGRGPRGERPGPVGPSDRRHLVPHRPGGRRVRATARDLERLAALGNGPRHGRGGWPAGRCPDQRAVATPHTARSVQGAGNDLAGLGLDLCEVLGAAERLGVDLVDVLGARRAGGEPRRFGARP